MDFFYLSVTRYYCTSFFFLAFTPTECPRNTAKITVITKSCTREKIFYRQIFYFFFFIYLDHVLQRLYSDVKNSLFFFFFIYPSQNRYLVVLVTVLFFRLNFNRTVNIYPPNIRDASLYQKLAVYSLNFTIFYRQHYLFFDFLFFFHTIFPLLFVRIMCADRFPFVHCVLVPGYLYASSPIVEKRFEVNSNTRIDAFP